MLHELKKSPGRSKAGKRLGRGNGSGSGNYSGKGIKGQKARAGGSVPAWFEGGQTPLYRRLPKLRGFKRYFKLLEKTEPVNIGALEAHEAIKSGDTVTKASLSEHGLIKSVSSRVKILGNGEIKKKLSFDGIEAMSATALAAVEGAGGSFVPAPVAPKPTKKVWKGEDNKVEVKTDEPVEQETQEEAQEQE